jgi:hypothetical protein
MDLIVIAIAVRAFLPKIAFSLFGFVLICSHFWNKKQIKKDPHLGVGLELQSQRGVRIIVGANGRSPLRNTNLFSESRFIVN